MIHLCRKYYDMLPGILCLRLFSVACMNMCMHDIIKINCVCAEMAACMSVCMCVLFHCMCSLYSIYMYPIVQR